MINTVSNYCKAAFTLLSLITIIPNHTVVKLEQETNHIYYATEAL